jgi:chromosome segregation ATPase
VLTLVFVVRLLRANARLRAHSSGLEAKCAEHVQTRRQSASTVAGNIGALRARVDELEAELEDAHVHIGNADLRVAQMQNQVDELHRANALGSVTREDLAASLQSQRLSLTYSRAEQQRAEETRRSAEAEREAVVREIADERRASKMLHMEIQELNNLLLEARDELARRGAEQQRQANVMVPWAGDTELKHFAEALSRGKEGLNEAILQHIAELLVLELPSQACDPQERQRAQRQLLTCLHPDKWPSRRVATRLMQEVQRTSFWVAMGQRGGS